MTSNHPPPPAPPQIVYSCEICGQDLPSEDHMKDHMKTAHLEGSRAAGLSLPPDPHTNQPTLDFLTPERDEVYFLEDDGLDSDFDSIWQLERGAKEGLTSGIDESPVGKNERRWPFLSGSGLLSQRDGCQKRKDQTEHDLSFMYHFYFSFRICSHESDLRGYENGLSHVDLDRNIRNHLNVFSYPHVDVGNVIKQRGHPKTHQDVSTERRGRRIDNQSKLVGVLAL